MNRIPLKNITFQPTRLFPEATLSLADHPNLWSATAAHLQDTLGKLDPEGEMVHYTLVWEDGRTLSGSVKLQPGVTTPQDLDLSRALKESTTHLMQASPEALGLSETDLRAARERTQDLMLGYDLGPAFPQASTEF